MVEVVGRPESPVTVSGPVGAFAAELRELRVQAGRPTYRQLSRNANYSAATLARAAGGQALPSLDVTLAYVRACRGDLVHWRRRWEQAALLVQRVSAERIVENRRPGSPTGDREPSEAGAPRPVPVRRRLVWRPVMAVAVISMVALSFGGWWHAARRVPLLSRRSGSQPAPDAPPPVAAE
jgi:hypothetical protein